MSDIKEQVSANRRDTERRLEQVRNDAHLSEEGKRQKLYEIHSQAMQRHEALVEQHEAEQHKELEDLHNQLFGLRFTIGQADYQRSNLKAEFRRNLTEADNALEDRGVEGLQRFMERARLAGDRHAERAAFAVAHSRSFGPVVEAYLEANGTEERERYEAYQQLDRRARNPNPADLFAQSFELAPPPRPPEIENYRPPTSGGEQDLVSSDRFFRGMGAL
jgi:hypothetical protein